MLYSTSFFIIKIIRHALGLKVTLILFFNVLKIHFKFFVLVGLPTSHISKGKQKYEYKITNLQEKVINYNFKIVNTEFSVCCFTKYSIFK